jgi:hypothetical protein
MTDRRLAFMRNTFLGVTLFSTGQLTAADGQFPYLHVYLNTPNCSAHTAGVMMLGSIDQRCARAVFLPEQGQALRAAMTGTHCPRTRSTDRSGREDLPGSFSAWSTTPSTAPASTSCSSAPIP